MAQYFEDFSAFTVGETAPSGFTKRAGTGTKLLVQADASAPGGKALKLTRSGSDNSFVEWGAIGSDENRGTLDFVALIRANAWNASTAAFTLGGLVGRSAGDTLGLLNGFYGTIGSDTGKSSSGAQLRVRKLISNTGTLVKSPTTGTWTINTRYWLRLRLSGTTYIFSLYPYADPLGTPIDEMTGTASAANGTDRVGLHVFASSSDLSVLYLAAGTNGDTPPLPSGDTSAPTLTAPTATATGATTASGTVSTNEANGTLYWLASANATETDVTVKAGSSQAVTATGEQPVTITGLTAATPYYPHYLHRDAAGNDSAVASGVQFTTEAEAVVVKGASIALYNGSTPQASIAGIRALWWDATAPGATPDYYTASASTDASGALTLDLDAATGLDVGDYGYLLLHKDGTLGAQYRDALEFAGAVQITDIS